MRPYQLRHFLGLGVGLAAAVPAWGQSGVEPAELAKAVGSGVALLLLYGLLLVFFWLGVPLLLGLAALIVGRRHDPAHQAGAWGPLGLALLVWLGGLDGYGRYVAASLPATEEPPTIMELLLSTGGVVPILLLVAATLGAAVAGYFLVRQPRPAPPPGRPA